MKEFKGTPGPWHVSNEGCMLIRDEDGLSIVAKIAGYNTKIKEISNANLIAAAPELFEALQRCESVLSSIPLDVCDVEDLIYARSVIAKALGESR